MDDLERLRRAINLENVKVYLHTHPWDPRLLPALETVFVPAGDAPTNGGPQ